MNQDQAMQEAALLASMGMSHKGIAQYLGGRLSYWQVARLAKKVPRRKGPRALKRGLRDGEKTAALLGLVEGLRLRARKKEEFGYLSARKLHVAIRLVLPLSMVAAFAYLLMPMTTSPSAVMVAAPLVLAPVCLLAGGNLPEKI